jgi:hypothetical protein
MPNDGQFFGKRTGIVTFLSASTMAAESTETAHASLGKETACYCTSQLAETVFTQKPTQSNLRHAVPDAFPCCERRVHCRAFGTDGSGPNAYSNPDHHGHTDSDPDPNCFR